MIVCTSRQPAAAIRPEHGDVLLVCDHPLPDPAIACVMRELGRGCVLATSASAALALVREHDFALVLLASPVDHVALVPIARSLRAAIRAPGTPLIALGLPPVPDTALEPLYEAGVIDVVRAPVSPLVLKTKARFYLGTFDTAAEHCATEAALRETSERLESVIDAAELATWSWDVRADRVSADARMGELFGIPPEALDNSPVARWFNGIHPDDVAGTRALVDQALRDGAPYTAVYRVRAHGEWRWVVARGRVEWGADGLPLRMRGVVMDANRQVQAEQLLRASEERYRTLFNSLDQGVCVIEVLFDDAGIPCDYRFLEVNPGFIAHSGLPDPTGKTIREIVPTLEQHWFDMYGHVATTGEPVRFTHQAAPLDRWFDVYATRIGPPEAHRIAILFTDVTARRMADQELRRITADLAQADRLKTEFLATLAHELRNPLAPIRSGLQLMRRSGNDAATVRRVQDIMDRQLDHLVHLVDDLLDVARITRGQVELKPEWVDLGQVLSAAVEISRPLIEVARHQLVLELPPEPVRLYVDATRITQVVSNLLNNAARYTPRGGRIVLSAARDDGQARITVADNGIGIARAALPEIFKIFTRAVGAEQVDGGLGIGLSLVRSFVELHGGSVSADSAGPGHGAVFTVRLPLQPAVTPPAPRSSSPATAPAHAGPLRVLVVDDNRDAAETLAALLDAMGHAAPIAHDGQQALRMMHSIRPHVVLLDIGMPGMSGYDVAQAIRRDPAWDDVRLVALTGWGGETDRARSAGAGFDEHLTKPATIEAIEAVLARAAAHAGAVDAAPAAT